MTREHRLVPTRPDREPDVDRPVAIAATGSRATFVNLLVAVVVLFLLHLFFVRIPSHLADRPVDEGRGATASAESRPTPGPVGPGPGVPAAPDRS
ncbi:MAG: hypothetical protein KC591_03330 [Gemmatimonadetes bacterium]|nr:hypothetical protein [Gemmatimonadota bacterium]